MTAQCYRDGGKVLLGDERWLAGHTAADQVTVWWSLDINLDSQTHTYMSLLLLFLTRAIF